MSTNSKSFLTGVTICLVLLAVTAGLIYLIGQKFPQSLEDMAVMAVPMTVGSTQFTMIYVHPNTSDDLVNRAIEEARQGHVYSLPLQVTDLKRWQPLRSE